jgi:succinyl-CoA synthetase beta subunit
MNIHEYQGKAILKSFGVRVQEGIVADTPEQAVEAAKKLKQDYNSDWVVVKAQIHAGGRGKGRSDYRNAINHTSNRSGR